MTFLICFGKPVWPRFVRYGGAIRIDIGPIGLWWLAYDFERWLGHIDTLLKQSEKEPS